MFALRATLFPIFGESHDFRADWYLHPLYFAVFLFGFAIAKHQPFFERCTAWRWPALAIALACWAAIVAYYAAYSEDVPPPEWQRLIMRGVRELDAWCAIVAAIGFAHRHLRGADGPVRRMLTQAIFPFYLIHQTIIVVAGFHLDDLQLPLWIEAPLLLGVTALGCWLFYDLGGWFPRCACGSDCPRKTKQFVLEAKGQRLGRRHESPSGQIACRVEREMFFWFLVAVGIVVAADASGRLRQPANWVGRMTGRWAPGPTLTIELSRNRAKRGLLLASRAIQRMIETAWMRDC